jgi:hypothetical protein
VSDSSTLHSSWLLLLKIEISSIVHCCSIINLNELQFLLQLHGNRGEDLNVKVYDIQRTDGQRRTPSDGKSSHGLWPGELKTKANKKNLINHSCYIRLSREGKTEMIFLLL